MVDWVLHMSDPLPPSEVKCATTSGVGQVRLGWRKSPSENADVHHYRVIVQSMPAPSRMGTQHDCRPGGKLLKGQSSVFRIFITSTINIK